MSDNYKIFEGETLEEALEAAEKDSGKQEERLDYEILEGGNRGFLGIGKKLVQIKVFQDKAAGATNEITASAKEFYSGVLDLLGFEGDVNSKQVDSAVEIDISGDEVGLLIGRRGQNMDALRMLGSSALAHRWQQKVIIALDINDYQKKRHEKLEDFAKKVAQQVTASKRPRSLQPMSAADRRAVHMALQSAGDVYTESEGSGPDRKVVIYPGKRKLEETG